MITIMLVFAACLTDMGNMSQVEAASYGTITSCSNSPTLNNGYWYTVTPASGTSTVTVTAAAGKNGLNVASGAKVGIYIPTGVTLNVTGGAGSGRTAGGAGIYVPSNATLIIAGGGTLNATGGDGTAATGGVAGASASTSYSSVGSYYSGLTLYTGNGGTGGNGGAGAGAGIGTPGGNGGAGGSGGSRTSLYFNGSNVKKDYWVSSMNGSGGGSGSGSAACGTIYVIGTVSVKATAGSTKTGGGTGGGRGTTIVLRMDGYNVSQSAGGGGGGGGGGSAGYASAIGAGGFGGGGGGGGGAGGLLFRSKKDEYYCSPGYYGTRGTGYNNGTNGTGATKMNDNSWSVYVYNGMSNSWWASPLQYTSENLSPYGGGGGGYGTKGSDGSLYVASTASVTGRSATSTSITYSSLLEANYNLYANSPSDAAVSVNGTSVAATGYMNFAYYPGQSTTLPTNVSLAGYTFDGWYTAATGGTKATTIANNVANNQNMYAQWRAHTYTVKYDSNVPIKGLTVDGTMEDSTFTYGAAKTPLRSNSYQIAGYAFKGWKIKDGPGIVYTDGAKVSNLTTEDNGVVTLEAQWEYCWIMDTESSEGAITATFDNHGDENVKLEYGNKKKVSLELKGTVFKYTGQEHTPTVSPAAVDNFMQITGLAVLDPIYYEITDEGEIELPGAPKAVGQYKMVLPITSSVASQVMALGLDDLDEEPSPQAFGGEYELVKFFSIEDGAENFGGADILNQTGEDGEIWHKVTGEATANLKVIHIPAGTTALNLYKVASVSYNSTDDLYEEPVWVDKVLSWIREVGSDYDAPANLGNVSAADSKIFYHELFYGTEKITLDKWGENKLEPVPDVEWTDIDGGKYIENLPVGQYVVVPEGSKHYVPAVVNIIPKRTGATGGSFLDYVYIRDLKEADAALYKYINESYHYDTLSIGEDVDFKILLEMPTYKDRVTGEKGTADDYRVYVEDLMDEAFASINKDDIKVYYVKTEEVTETIDNEEVTVPKEIEVELTNSQYSFYKFLEAGDNEVPDDGSIKNDDIFNEELKEKYYTQDSDYLYTITEPETVNVDGVDYTKFRIDFSMGALKTWAKETFGSASVPNLVIRYETTTTEKLRVASEDNTNTATIFYEKGDSIGELASQPDTVRGYTYGLTVHKVNGDAIEDHLAGASFRLYKKIASFRDLDDDGTYTFDNHQVMGSEAAVIDKTLNEYEQIMGADGKPKYFVSFYNDEASGDDVADVYERIMVVDEDGSIKDIFISTDSTSGNTVQGLKEGYYILEELEAPNGFNKFEGGLAFTINRFSAEDIQKGIATSLKSFKDEEGNEQTSGLYSITVLNYKGLVLPSTGGVGTMLFTMFGVAIMLVAVVAVIAVRKNKYGKYDL